MSSERSQHTSPPSNSNLLDHVANPQARHSFTRAERIKDSTGEARRQNGTSSSKMVGGSEDDEQMQASTSVGHAHCEKPVAVFLITHFEEAASATEEEEEAAQSKEQERRWKMITADETVCGTFVLGSLPN